MLRARRLSVVVCVVGSAAALGWGAQIVLSHVVAEAKAQPQLVSVSEQVSSEAYVPPRHVPAPVTSSPPATSVASTGGIIYVRVDARGLPLELSTNNGKPPAEYEAILASRNGQPVLVSEALARLVHQHTFTGDWSRAGTWHPWVESP